MNPSIVLNPSVLVIRPYIHPLADLAQHVAQALLPVPGLNRATHDRMCNPFGQKRIVDEMGFLG